MNSPFVQEALVSKPLKDVMNEEMTTLENNQTWEIVDLPKRKRLMGSKWIFTVKYKYDGSLDKYKVRLVTKGYSQTYCIDYHVTLALAAKMNTIDILLSLVAVKDWSLHQVDVKNVFLHRDLEEEVYMDIPPQCGTEYKRTSSID